MLLFYYFLEFNFRILYIIISFVISSFVSVFYFKSILLLETYPVIQEFLGKFIIIHITEVFDILFLLTCSISFFLVIPLFIYQFYCFFNIGWYKYQSTFIKNLLIFYFILIIIISIFYYWIILPNTLLFFTQWTFLKNTNYLLNMEIEFNVLLYIIWVIKFKYNFITLFVLVLLICVHLLLFYPVLCFYVIIKFYRKQLVFLSITIIYMIIPPDIVLQIILLLILVIILEISFFFMCYKFYNFNDSNYAYN